MSKPQVVKTDEGEVNLIRPVPPLENLVLRGGGVKGVGNPPALVVMDKEGMLGGLKHIVGTSAGALTALCLASGTSAKDFQTLSDNNPPSKLQGSPENWEKLYPMMEFGLKGYSAVNALQIADQATMKNVTDFLANSGNDPLRSQIEALPLEEQVRLQVLKTANLDGNRTGKMVTFKDLEILKKLDSDKFKTLTLTGFDEKRGETFYFDARNYPDMPIAVAGRISMSIPQYFASVNYDPGDKLGKRHFVDGGVGSNMPTEVVTRGAPFHPATERTGHERQDVLVRTAIMTFDEGGDKTYDQTIKDVDRNKDIDSGKLSNITNWRNTPGELTGAYKAMHGSREQNSSNVVSQAVFGATTQALVGNDLGATDRWDQQKISESAANCFVIGHGDLGTVSFGASQQELDQAKRDAAHMMNTQVAMRKDQAYAQTFKNMDEVYKVLTPGEKQEILKAPPDASNTKLYPLRDQDPGYKADMELYTKVHSETLSQKLSQLVENEGPKTSVRDSLKKSGGLKVEEGESMKVEREKPELEKVDGEKVDGEKHHSVKESLGSSSNSSNKVQPTNTTGTKHGTSLQ